MKKDLCNKTVPLYGTKKYLMSHLVVIIHEYPMFGLVKIRYQDSNAEFIIDSKSLSEIPISEHTINIGLLDRG